METTCAPVTKARTLGNRKYLVKLQDVPLPRSLEHPLLLEVKQVFRAFSDIPPQGGPQQLGPPIAALGHWPLCSGSFPSLTGCL